MDSKDIELKNALDEIFGDDIIELEENIPITIEKELTNEELFENTSTLVFNQNDIIDSMEEKENNLVNNIDFSKKTDGNDEDFKVYLENFDTPVLDLKTDDAGDNNEIILEKQEENKDAVIEENIDINEESISNSTKNTVEKNKKIPISMVVIIGIVVVVLTFIAVYFITSYINNKEKVINCSYTFDDKNSKITDEYKITFKNKKIFYIEGVYIYTSKVEEFNEQIKYIKEDKLPAIINSNGMKGFTYTYENTDNSLKISSYLDYSIMDEKEINSVNQETKPISYFKVDLKENSKNLINLFEKQGYKCITSK